MDERLRRLWAGAGADAFGSGGIAAVERPTGLSRTTIRAGRDKLRAVDNQEVVSVRRSGAGRPRSEELDPELVRDLESLVDRVTRGAPESPQRWTSKSTRKLAQLLKLRGHPISPQKVGLLLNEAGYSLQGTSKMEEGDDHPDRNAQFEFINDQVDEFQGRGSPVISVDTKNKELVGDSGNRGKEWQPLGCRVPIMVHDFPNDATGKAIPYGVYDLAQSQVLANVGIDHDTPEFAVALILRGVADDGQEGPSRCHGTFHHRRCWRK